MIDDRVLKRWMAKEGQQMNQGLVRSAKPLADVLAMDPPELPTRSEPHRFDRETLEAFSQALSAFVAASVKVPITFYLSHQTPQDCYVSDALAIRALEQLELATSQPRDGKLWLSRPTAYEIAKAWPTVFQFCRV